MFYSSNSFYVAVLLGFSGLLAPAHALEQTLSDAAKTEKAQYHVLAGEMAAGSQQPALAAQELLMAVELVPDVSIVKRATGMALLANLPDLSLQAANKWFALDPTDLDAQEIIIRLSLRNGNTATAYKLLQGIVSGHPGGADEGFRYVASLLSQDPAAARTALSMMRKLVAERPLEPAAHRALSLLAFRFRASDEALREAKEALRLAPKSNESALLLVAALVSKDDLVAADAAIEPLLKDPKTRKELRTGYIKLLLDQDHKAAAKVQLQKQLAEDADDSVSHFMLGVLEFDERAIASAETHLTAAAKNRDQSAEAAYYLGRIAEINGLLLPALAWYEKAEASTAAVDSWYRRGALLVQLKRTAEMRELFDGLRQQNPDMVMQLYSREAQLLLDANDPKAAIAVFDSALTQRADDTDALYARSMIYEKINRIDLAEADLRHVLSKSSQDSRSLNALGYLLASHNLKLEEAEALIAKAHALSPNDPAVMDSQGWVAFKLGKYDEALGLLNRAYSLLPDAEIAAHIGEVLWAKGEKTQAREILATALKRNPEHPVLLELQNRLILPQ